MLWILVFSSMLWIPFILLRFDLDLVFCFGFYSHCGLISIRFSFLCFFSDSIHIVLWILSGLWILLFFLPDSIRFALWFLFGFLFDCWILRILFVCFGFYSVYWFGFYFRLLDFTDSIPGLWILFRILWILFRILRILFDSATWTKTR